MRGALDSVFTYTHVSQRLRGMANHGVDVSVAET